MDRSQIYKVMYINILALIVLSGCGCQDSNPLSPLESATLTAYFPLQAGYKAKYAFSLVYSDWSVSIRSRKVYGTCQLNVIQALEKNQNKYIKISTDFLIEKDIMSYVPEYGDEIKDEKINFTQNLIYDMLLSADSAWYVKDAPDFSRLEEGSRTLTMHAPEIEYNAFDLALLAYPGWDQYKFSGLKAEFKGDSLIYSYTRELVLDDQNRITVKMAKGKGIISFYYWRYQGGGYHTFVTRTELNYSRLPD